MAGKSQKGQNPTNQMLAQQQGLNPFAAQYAMPAYGTWQGYDPLAGTKGVGWQDGDTEPDPFDPPDPVEVVARGGTSGRATPGPRNVMANPGVTAPVTGAGDTPGYAFPAMQDYNYTPAWLSSYYTPYDPTAAANPGTMAPNPAAAPAPTF